MIITVKKISNVFRLDDGLDYRNVTIEFPTGEERDITVEVPITKEKAIAALKTYWAHHGHELTEESDPLVGQQIDVVL